MRFVKAFWLVMSLKALERFVLCESGASENNITVSDHIVREAMCRANCYNQKNDSCFNRCNSNDWPTAEIIHYQGDSFKNAVEDLEVLCKNVLFGSRSCPLDVASVYLKWKVSDIFANERPAFIVSTRFQQPVNQTSDWIVNKIVPVNFLEVQGLKCDTMYQFQVTAVSASGMLYPGKVSSWTKTPGNSYRPSKPISFRVETHTIMHNKPSVTVAWTPGESTSCFYKIYWFGKTGWGQEEIKIPRDFRFRINNLDYSFNYTFRLESYLNDTFKDSSEEVFLHEITPGCLEATSYNHKICAPLRPNNLSLEVLTPFHEDKNLRNVSVKLSWEPPLYTRNGSDVIKYLLNYRKVPPINVADHLLPHKAGIEINATNTSVILDQLHNHNMYNFELAAETLGGIGELANLNQYIGLRVSSTTVALLGHDILAEKKRENGMLNMTELVVVVLVPVVLFIILITIISVIVFRRRKQKRYSTSRHFGPVEEMNPIYDAVTWNIYSDKTNAIAPDGYEIDFTNLDFISVIGEGAFGKVVKAEYCPQANGKDKAEKKIVAVKMLRDFYTVDESRNFLLEIQAMKNLGHNPYIVSIIGCCLTGPKLCLVMDYCALGDLKNYLRKYRDRLMYTMCMPKGMPSMAQSRDIQEKMLNRDHHQSNISLLCNAEDDANLSEARLLSYARQITMGMEFLEQRKFVHRDLAARNILMHSVSHVKISDFGLTRDVYETNVYQPTSARKLPYKWMAIESLFSQRFSIKSDVWSFGILLWEIMTLGGSPYPSIPLQELYGLLNDGYRMEKPENCSTKLYQIMLSCWHPMPYCRPAFSQLKYEIDKLLECTRSYIDLSAEITDGNLNEQGNVSTSASQLTKEAHAAFTDIFDKHSSDYLQVQKHSVDIHNKHKSNGMCYSDEHTRNDQKANDAFGEIVTTQNELPVDLDDAFANCKLLSNSEILDNNTRNKNRSKNMFKMGPGNDSDVFNPHHETGRHKENTCVKGSAHKIVHAIGMYKGDCVGPKICSSLTCMSDESKQTTSSL